MSTHSNSSTPASLTFPASNDGRPRALLIGTAATLGLLSDQIALLPNGPIPVGYVLADADRPVLGFDTLETLPRVCATVRPDLAIVSLPAERTTTSLRVRSLLSSLSLPERVVPPLDELLRRTPHTAGARGTLNWADLIGRTPHGIDRHQVASMLEGRRVLITGAGGSIGSEIARIVAGFRPELVVLMERAENALFEIDRQIRERFPNVKRKAILHDVTDTDGTMRHLAAERPHVVFHAAAHKHVPLMEDHPSHAVNNNFFGTRSIADASLAVGAERFVLISSDKAVNPTSVMGATKRLAEMYVQGLHRQSRAVSPASTRFCMVRFGNVLGSACSVLPIWASQIDAGGPVTVTDERMTRYFMTIQEAAMLVIQAAALQGDSPAAPVYVLDMGDPIRILDLACRFISAHGLSPAISPQQPGTGDIQIRFTGARPGEKLYEELAYDREQLSPTAHPGIGAWTTANSGEINLPLLVADLAAVRTSHDKEAVLTAIRKHVPEMRPSGLPADIKPLEQTLTKTDPSPAIAA
jgi:FlaA1/EpsC-like NDP-sugar epimerase